jgi:hypothetical protein
MDAGIGQQGFQLATGSGISQTNAADILFDQLQE